MKPPEAQSQMSQLSGTIIYLLTILFCNKKVIHPYVSDQLRIMKIVLVLHNYYTLVIEEWLVVIIIILNHLKEYLQTS